MATIWTDPDRDELLSAAPRNLAVSMRAKGMSLRQIGKELNVSEITIRRDLADWEQETRHICCDN